MTRISLYGVLAMTLVVLASNILVQYPVGQWLTWGAFTYPLAFLVSDIINRLEGAKAARRVVYAGFVVGLGCSVVGSQIMTEFGPLVTLRVAIGSATAFLLGQLLDITVFDRLRRNVTWWKAPFVSTLFGSTLDTAIFFSIAFSTALIWIEPGNDVSWAAGPVPLLGFGTEVPFWVSLAVADWMVKVAVDVIALLPFRLAVYRFVARVA
jgi:queuosine precursor transporter